MSMRLQIILLVVLVIALAALIRQVKHRRLNLKYTLPWFLLVVALIVLTCFPKLLLLLSASLGITTPVNMIFFCGFCFSLVIIYTLTMAISKMSDHIRCLAQKVALLEGKYNEDNE